MDMERIIGVGILMLILFSVLNIINLRITFKKFRINSENICAIKKFKKKWSTILFSDLLFYSVLFFIIVVMYTSIFIAYLFSMIFTIIYMVSIGIRIEKRGEKIFGTDFIKTKNLTKISIKTEQHIKRNKINDMKNFNITPYNKENISDLETGETRKLTINRMKAFAASLVKVFVFVESDDFSVNDIGIKVGDKQYKRVGTISYGKTLDILISLKSVEILIATLLSNNLQNYSCYSISPGNSDVILNVKPIYSLSAENAFKIERIK